MSIRRAAVAGAAPASSLALGSSAAAGAFAVIAAIAMIRAIFTRDDRFATKPCLACRRTRVRDARDNGYRFADQIGVRSDAPSVKKAFRITLPDQVAGILDTGFTSRGRFLRPS